MRLLYDKQGKGEIPKRESEKGRSQTAAGERVKVGNAERLQRRDQEQPREKCSRAGERDKKPLICGNHAETDGELFQEKSTWERSYKGQRLFNL